MASRKSRSSAQSASRADPTARFRAALDAKLETDPTSLQHALRAAWDSEDVRRCNGAFASACAAAARHSNDGHRPERITAPSDALAPLLAPLP